MTGTIVNCFAIIAGSLIGLLFKKGMSHRLESSINKALGVAVLVVGFNGVVTNMITVGENGTLASSGELILVLSLVIGMLIGELLKIDDRLNTLSQNIEDKFKMDGFAKGFVSATILFCVGAMAIVGSINDGLLNDPSILYIKSMLDFTASIIFAATMGYGVIFSLLPVLIYQGGISLLAEQLGGFLQGELLTQLCMVGYAIIITIGLNFVADTKIKTANMLPSLFVPIAYLLIKGLF